MNILKDNKLGSVFLLLSQMLERIVFYSISANFVYTLNSKPLMWMKINAMNATFLHSGFCFIFTMFGGILSDSFIKKSTTVILGYIFYLAYAGFIIVFYPNRDIQSNVNISQVCNIKKETPANIFQETCSAILIPIVVLCAIGSGLIKSVMASIGADMAVKYWKYPSVFFNMYYWSLNLGSLISFSLITFIQQNVSKLYGFIIPGVCLVISFSFFLFGMPYHIVVPKPSRSTLNLVFSIYHEAFKKKFFKTYKSLVKIKNTSTDYQTSSTIQEILVNNDRNSFSQKRADYPSLNAGFFDDFDNSSDETSTIIETTISESTNDISFLDRSKIRFGGKFSEDDVEDVRKFSTTLIIIAFLIPYWLLYFQMETSYLNQALNLNLGIPSNHKYSIPASWLSMIDIITIMFLLPILVHFVYPYLRNKNLYPDFSIRIVFGMILAVISMIAAGVLEYYINLDFKNKRISIQTIGGTSYNYSNISVWSQIPQYFVLGISESQTIIAGLELACTQVPTSMQAVTNGIFWFFSGIGSFLGTCLVFIFRPYEQQNEHNYCYFFTLAIIQAIFILLFLLCIFKIRQQQKIQSITVTSSLRN